MLASFNSFKHTYRACVPTRYVQGEHEGRVCPNVDMHANRCGYKYVCAQKSMCRHASVTLKFEHHGYAYVCLDNYACMCKEINKGGDWNY